MNSKIYSRIYTLLILTLVSAGLFAQSQYSESTKKAVLVIHGGAGTILKENMSPEKEAELIETMGNALMKGYKIIKKGKSSEEAIIAAINHLEDDPNFNAGKGAVLNEEGNVELDASIMNGKDLQAGAIAGVHGIKNPINAARAVKDHSKHVLLSGEGAEKFARSEKLKFEEPEYFITDKAKASWLKAKKNSESSGYLNLPVEDHKFGTVGAVALDKDGNISAGTSTGGMMMKKYGRIGDSPLIGSGTYADNSTAGVSCTGHGEFFIRYAVAYDLVALMKYKEMSINEAADEIIQNKLMKAGGAGGLIALDKDGNFAFSFNTPGMYRGVIFDDATMLIDFYKE
ncbi:MAG: isoaspartyl peptidase/L-asparaginase [Cytophagales bacterium]